jgi:hypothetical protein
MTIRALREFHPSLPHVAGALPSSGVPSSSPETAQFLAAGWQSVAPRSGPGSVQHSEGPVVEDKPRRRAMARPARGDPPEPASRPWAMARSNSNGESSARRQGASARQPRGACWNLARCWQRASGCPRGPGPDPKVGSSAARHFKSREPACQATRTYLPRCTRQAKMPRGKCLGACHLRGGAPSSEAVQGGEGPHLPSASRGGAEQRGAPRAARRPQGRRRRKPSASGLIDCLLRNSPWQPAKMPGRSQLRPHAQ